MAVFRQSFDHNSKYTLQFTVYEISNSINIENNTSDVYWQLDLISGGSSFSGWYVNSLATVKDTVLEDNSKKTIGYNSVLTLGSGTKTITHNSDGSAEISVGASVNTATSQSYLPGSAVINAKLTLTTIPRASNVYCSSPYIGDVATITIDKKVSSFTNTIIYDIDGITGTLKNKTSDAVVSFNTEPLKEQIYNKIPNSKSITGKIYCTTYSGDTQIGDTQSTNFNLYIKENECIPYVSMTLSTIDSVSLGLTKNPNVVIKGVSSVQAQISSLAKNGANISSTVFSCDDGQKVNNAINPTLEKVKSGIFKVTVIDTRGLTNSYTITKTTEDKTFVDYIPLAFTSVDLGRLETTSNTIKAVIKGNYYNGNFGTLGRRKIQVGDDLSGKTLYFDFPTGLYEMLYEPSNIITTDNSSIASFIDISTVNTTGVNCINENGESVYFYEYTPSSGESKMTEYTLSNGFGTVTAINTNNPAYNYIYIKAEDDTSNTLELKYRYREQGGEWTANKETVLSTTLNVTEMEEFMGGSLEWTFEGGEGGKETWVGYLPNDNKPSWVVTEYNSDNELIVKVYKTVATGMSVLTPTIDENTFTFDGNLGTDFDYKKQYEFEFYAEDKLIYTSATDKPIIVPKGISIIRVGDGYVDVRGDLMLNGKKSILTYTVVE